MAADQMIPRLALILWAYFLTPAIAHAQSTYEYANSVTQQGQVALSLDFYSGGQMCDKPRPTAIFIHGGGFRGGNRDHATKRGIAQAFTQSGINLASISYRLNADKPVLESDYLRLFEMTVATNPKEKYPGQIRNAFAAFEDTSKAINYIIANADRDCVDAQKIFLIGTSAGAVTALNVGYNLSKWGIEQPNFAGVISLWGGGMPAEAIQPNDAPLFIVHGERDKTTPFAFAQSYWEQANLVGIPVQFHAFQKIKHGLNLKRSYVDGVLVMDLIIAFIETISADREIVAVRTRN